MQSKQAANANDERNARLNYGKNAVQQVFEGVPSGSSLLDLSSITQANAPQNLTLANQNPAAAAWVAAHPETAYADPYPTVNASAANRKAVGSSGYTWGYAPDTGGSPSYALYDPSGTMVDQAAILADLAAAKIYTGGDASKKTGGFGDDFYGNYRNSILDYYMPQAGSQYNDARTSLQYSLQRAGQSNSSVAGMDIAKLSKQDELNWANIASQADTQTGALRTTISQDEQSALNQLYSTEDPDGRRQHRRQHGRQRQPHQAASEPRRGAVRPDHGGRRQRPHGVPQSDGLHQPELVQRRDIHRPAGLQPSSHGGGLAYMRSRLGFTSSVWLVPPSRRARASSKDS